MLCSYPVLKVSVIFFFFKIVYDASASAAVSALLQKDDDGLDHPFAYFSKKFPVAQGRYSVVEEKHFCPSY